ncbi:hypothetical protein JOB18_042227 [Solea senegalensis]|uniref:Uncharacterized protein n=1 Tax=Solea senegalensis TaxID=28829 RepID=A0AAV6S5R0_SOLSE|nr:hypothetical protein JOB18_042227 [Solea senegalensis]KAG7512890.1 hypothetical protein JOB18_042227 [Solea senegalensis]
MQHLPNKGELRKACVSCAGTEDGGYSVYKCHLDCVQSHYHCGFVKNGLSRQQPQILLQLSTVTPASSPVSTVTPASSPVSTVTPAFTADHQKQTCVRGTEDHPYSKDLKIIRGNIVSPWTKKDDRVFILFEDDDQVDQVMHLLSGVVESPQTDKKSADRVASIIQSCTLISLDKDKDMDTCGTERDNTEPHVQGSEAQTGKP